MDVAETLALALRYVDEAETELGRAGHVEWQSDLATSFHTQLAHAQSRVRACGDLVARARATATAAAPQCFDVR